MKLVISVRTRYLERLIVISNLSFYFNKPHEFICVEE